VLLPLAIVALALANVFGQRPDTTSAAAAAATVGLYAPSTVRSGLIFEARFDIRAQQELRDARLVLGPGWLEGMTLNTISPSPTDETSANGQLVLDLGRIHAGERHLLFLQFQVNPTNAGRRAQPVDLYDGSQRILSIDRTITIFP
jgi:hypothetical protein